MSDQFTVLAEQLSKIEEQIEELNEKKSKTRQIAFDLLVEQNKTHVNTIFGNFTRCSGKTTTTYNSPEYLKAENQLNLAKAKAKINKQFTTKTGVPYLKFE